MFILRTILLFSIVFLPIHVQGREKVITLATLTDFAPYCFRKENSLEIAEESIAPGKDSAQLQGYSWDVVRESFHEIGYTINLIIVPWERGMHYLKNGRVEAIFPANRTEAREQFFIYSKEYVDRTRMVAYVPVDSTVVWNNGLDSLNGLAVGVVRGWAYGKKWEENKNIRKEIMDTILQSFEVMERKRLNAVVGYEFVYDYVLKDNGMTERFKKIGDFGLVDEYLMCRRDDPVAIEKLKDFDRGHALLEKRGGLEQIINRWH